MLLKCKEDAERQRGLVEQALAVVNKQLKENFTEEGEDEKEEPKAATAAKPVVPSITPEMLTREVVVQHMATDHQHLEGLSEDQALRIMTSMFALFNNLSQKKGDEEGGQVAAVKAAAPMEEDADAETISDDEDAPADDDEKMKLVESNKL